MIYDSTKAFDWDSLFVRFNTLYQRGRSKRTLIELVDKTNRTPSQNNYLHVIIGYLALQLGYDMEYTKKHLFKYAANKDIFFVGWQHNPYTNVSDMKLRSTRDLSVEEMSLAIDRFLKWSAEETGILLPTAQQKEFVQECMVEVENHKNYL